MEDHLYTKEHNCYSYVIHDPSPKKWAAQSPGQRSNRPRISSNTNRMKGKTIKRFVKSDFPHWKEIKYHPYPQTSNKLNDQTHYLIVLVMDPGRDFHFFKYIDGQWKHKPGPAKPRTLPLDTHPLQVTNIGKYNYQELVTTFLVPKPKPKK